MKVGSLFSGVGGIEIGFEKQGFETEWFVENEPYAQAILKKRFPEAKIYGDITKLDFGEIPRVDILTGGFPCQDISNAGKRVGIEGSRSSLWKYYLKAIMQIRPKFALIENVSALLGRGLDVVLCDLASIGYDAEWYCVSASSVGAFHKRDRIFIIAYPNSNWKSNGSFNEEEGQRFVDVSNTNPERRKGRRENEIRCKELSNTDKRRVWELQSLQGLPISWAVEPKLGRVAHGISNRVDRIRCLGNAVVPQVAEIFAEAINEGER